MITRSRFVAVILAIVAAVTVATSTASAGVPWACVGTTIRNNTTCAIPLTLGGGPAGAILRVNVPPGPNTVVLINTAGVTSIDFVFSWRGNPFLVLAPMPVAPCNCGPTDWSTCCVELTPTCCCDVCFDQATCTITINPAACIPPGPCRS